MKTKFFLFFLLLCLGVSSCETENEEDIFLVGDWPPMEWKTIPEIQFPMKFPYHVVQIPAEGAEYTFICTNYGFTNLTVRNYEMGVLFTEMDVNDIVEEELNESQPHFENEWLSITEDTGSSIKIVAQPNQTTSSRKMYLDTGCCDVFTSFIIIQSSGKQ
ncbi:MAG: hypothetical protein J6M53_04070 [Bacteroidaceae bacterium]|nr:hypothetical protein [Bacteroidaceae bacterium]